MRDFYALGPNMHSLVSINFKIKALIRMQPNCDPMPFSC